VSEELLRLTVYAGERARADGRFLTDALAAIFARHRLHVSVVLRATAGFGPAARLRTDRLLSLSEDLPIVTVAVDVPDRVHAAMRDVDALRFRGLVTAEPVSADGAGESVQLTVYARRYRHRAIVATLHRHGVAGATALLGVDGTTYGERHRAHLVGDNRDVPVMVVAVGDAGRIAGAMTELDDELHTLERVRICRRDGAALAPLAEEGDAWQKVTVYTSEAAGLHTELLLRLRRAGAAGVTILRGVWGYHGNHAPHGDRLLQLRRRVPAVTVLIDTPANVARWAEIVEDVTAREGLVTSERVPVFRERG